MFKSFNKFGNLFCHKHHAGMYIKRMCSIHADTKYMVQKLLHSIILVNELKFLSEFRPLHYIFSFTTLNRRGGVTLLRS